MEAIYEHIAYILLSPDNAMGKYNRIADKIISLGYFPECIRVMDTEPEYSKCLRKLQADNYSVFYIIKQDRVIVTNVLYSASDIESRLRK